MSTLLRYGDRVLAALAVAALVALTARMTCYQPEWTDTVAYALPAANLVERGALSVPQLGTQMALDRTWLLNAPVHALGPYPLFLVLGVDRLSYLAGIWGQALAVALIYLFAFRSLLGLRSYAASAALSFAVLGSPLFLSNFYNQRYDVIGYGLMLLAFLPYRGRAEGAKGPAWWQWLSVGLLPLVHPGLIPAAALWLAWQGAGALAGLLAPSAPAGEPGRPRGSWSWVGVGLWAASSALVVAWYVRPWSLNAQFLPHLRFGNFRQGLHFLGTYQVVPTRGVYSLPCTALNLACVALALGVFAGLPFGPLREKVARGVLPALAVGMMLPLDAVRGFLYYSPYLLGIGPCLLAVYASGRGRRPVLVALGLLAVVNLAVVLRLDLPRGNPYWAARTAEGATFVEGHTLPGDRVVTGPPFVLLAAHRLHDGRSVPRVVPEPYFLDWFDLNAFRTDVGRSCDVYVGDPRWFERQVSVDPRLAPIFDDCDREEFVFQGQKVLVARSRRAVASRTVYGPTASH